MPMFIIASKYSTFQSLWSLFTSNPVCDNSMSHYNMQLVDFSVLSFQISIIIAELKEKSDKT